MGLNPHRAVNLPRSSLDPVPNPPVRNLKNPDDRPAAPEADRKKQSARLAMARQRFYKTASLAARALGIAGPTYLAHENGTRQIRDDIAVFYAEQFKVSADWILFNKGNGPDPDATEDGMSDASARSGIESSDAGLATLLGELNVSRGSTGSFVPRNPGQPGRLPPASQTGGWIAELGSASSYSVSSYQNECLVALSGDDGPMLALRDVFRLPLAALERSRLFVARLPMTADLWAGQYVFVDPDQTHIDDGIFLVMRQSGPPMAAGIMRSEGAGEPQIGWSGGKPPVDLAQSGFKIVGGIVAHHNPLASVEVHDILRRMFATR